jgi:3-dehydroquinate synthase
MVLRIPVSLSQNPYDVVVGRDLLDQCGDLIREVSPATRCAIVTDSNVGPLYADRVAEALDIASFHTTTITVPAGESSKSLGEMERVCDGMIAAGLDRGALLIALGGGVVGDLAGYAAASYYRGIPYVQIPTTVVAQVDSAVGGKTGVNARGGKNLIGAFHQPKLVIADTDTLGTLPKREFNEGFAEIIKHAVIRDAEMLGGLKTTPEKLPELIARNVRIKAAIVAEDEFERKGLRALLNFGHTIGHAIENAAGYGRYLHGEAISIGIAAALYLCRKKAGLSNEESDVVIGALKSLDLPVTISSDLTDDALLGALRTDKKFEAGAVRFVLTSRLGDAFVSKDVTEADIREAITAVRS